MTTRPYDLILYGATGFTGRLVAQVLSRRAPPGHRWALAGRDATKLQAIRDGLGLGELPILTADAAKPESLRALAASTRALITTVGPYALYGEPCLAACAEEGTHYVDLTGETPWIRDMIHRYDATARRTGAVIVPCCGYDSVPSELVTLLLVEHHRARGQGTATVRAFHGGKGGFSGGTLASMLNMAESGKTKQLMNPVLLNAPGDPVVADPDLQGAVYDADLGGWAAPFIMAAINTRVVRRSAALAAAAGRPYGPMFSYQEAMWLGSNTSRLAAGAVGVGLLGALILTGTGPGRALARRFGPAPGEGPSEEVRESGWTRSVAFGVATDGVKAKATLKGEGDPGYKFTSLLLAEAGLTLADPDRAPTPGGLSTPAIALGMPYVERLRAAGVTLTVEAL
jgi:short subunit dehydrogenase-like uncharacterized protein